MNPNKLHKIHSKLLVISEQLQKIARLLDKYHRELEQYGQEHYKQASLAALEAHACNQNSDTIYQHDYETLYQSLLITGPTEVFNNLLSKSKDYLTRLCRINNVSVEFRSPTKKQLADAIIKSLTLRRTIIQGIRPLDNDSLPRAELR